MAVPNYFGVLETAIKRLKYLSDNMQRLIELGQSNDDVISTLAWYVRGVLLLTKLDKLQTDEAVEVFIDITDDEQAQAFDKFMQSTPSGRAKMLVEAELHSIRESGIFLESEGE